MKYPILLPNIFNHPFTYESEINLKLGEFVLVSFGKSKITGVVWDEFEKNDNKKFKIKSIQKKLDVVPLKKETRPHKSDCAEHRANGTEGKRHFFLPVLLRVKSAHARNRSHYFLIANHKRQNGNGNKHQDRPGYPSRKINMPALWCFRIAII